MKNKFIALALFLSVLSLISPPIGSCAIANGCFMAEAQQQLAGYAFKGFEFIFCSGLIKPDTNLSGKITTLREVFNVQTTSYVFNRF